MSETRRMIVLERLRESGKKGITIFELMLSGGGTDSRKRISELRSDGYRIVDVWESVGKQRIKRYFIKE